MGYALLIGAAIFVVIGLYTFFQLGKAKDGNFVALQLFIIGTVLIGLMLFGQGVMSASQDCEWLINNTVVNIDNSTSYDYAYTCSESPAAGTQSLFRLITYFQRFFMYYLIIFLLLYIIDQMGWLPKEFQGILSFFKGGKK